MPHTARPAARDPVRGAALVLSALVLLAFVRGAVNRLRNDPDAQHAFAWFTGSGTLWGLFSHLSAAGLTWQSGGAFFGGLGTFLMGVTSLWREVRNANRSAHDSNPRGRRPG